MENQETVDKLLDKIAVRGIHSLTHAERDWLDKYSRNEKPGPLEQIPYNPNDFQKITEEDWAYRADSDDYSFVFQLQPLIRPSLMSYILTVNGKEYGCGTCRVNGQLEPMEFAVYQSCQRKPFEPQGNNVFDDFPEYRDALKEFVFQCVQTAIAED